MGAGFRSAAVALAAGRLLAAAGAALLLPRSIRADQAAGDTGVALPGFVRVATAGPFDTGFVLSGMAGYGYRGAVVADSDRHHRAAVDVAASYRPLDWLAIAARFSGRYDRHTDTGAGKDSGWIGDPRLAARASAPVGGGLWLAAQAGLWVPGRDAPSLEPGASTVDLLGLASWAPAGGKLSIGLQGGFRFDRSAEAIDRPDQLSPSDRMALGVSESDAVLLGAGAALRTGATEWVGEWSWDVLVGDRAPDARQSPMRLAAGVRRQLSQIVGLQLVAEYSLAEGPEPGAMDALFPIEPRFQALAGITIHPGRRSEPRGSGSLVDGGLRAADDRTVAGAWIEVLVVGAGGEPVSGADVVLLPTAGSEEVRMGRTGGDGRAIFEGLDRGLARVRVSYRGHRTSSRLVEVETGAKSTVRFSLSQALPPGQLRGVVRAFTGQPLAAELTVAPTGARTNSNARGEFEIDLPPGDYEVTVKADGYREQRSRIRIERDGVTILNLDLRRER